MLDIGWIQGRFTLQCYEMMIIITSIMFGVIGIVVMSIYQNMVFKLIGIILTQIMLILSFLFLEKDMMTIFNISVIRMFIHIVLLIVCTVITMAIGSYIAKKLNGFYDTYRIDVIMKMREEEE